MALSLSWWIPPASGSVAQGPGSHAHSGPVYMETTCQLCVPREAIPWEAGTSWAADQRTVAEPQDLLAQPPA